MPTESGRAPTSCACLINTHSPHTQPQWLVLLHLTAIMRISWSTSFWRHVTWDMWCYCNAHVFIYPSIPILCKYQSMVWMNTGLKLRNMRHPVIFFVIFQGRGSDSISCRLLICLTEPQLFIGGLVWRLQHQACVLYVNPLTSLCHSWDTVLPVLLSPEVCCFAPGCHGGAAALYHPPVTLPCVPAPNCALNSETKTYICRVTRWIQATFL